MQSSKAMPAKAICQRPTSRFHRLAANMPIESPGLAPQSIENRLQLLTFLQQGRQREFLTAKRRLPP